MFCLATLLYACSGHELPITDAPADAASTVRVVACPSTVAVEVTVNGLAFVLAPKSWLVIGEVARFTMPSSDGAVSGATPGVPDGEFRVPAGQTACLQFTQVGSFPFFGDPYQFAASLQVQQSL